MIYQWAEGFKRVNKRKLWALLRHNLYFHSDILRFHPCIPEFCLQLYQQALEKRSKPNIFVHMYLLETSEGHCCLNPNYTREQKATCNWKKNFKKIRKHTCYTNCNTHRNQTFCSYRLKFWAYMNIRWHFVRWVKPKTAKDIPGKWTSSKNDQNMKVIQKNKQVMLQIKTCLFNLSVEVACFFILQSLIFFTVIIQSRIT